MRGRKTREAAGKAFDRVIYVSHAHNHKVLYLLPGEHAPGVISPFSQGGQGGDVIPGT